MGLGDHGLSHLVSACPDPRTDPWPLVHSPIPVILLLLLYLFLVLVGPRAMSLRPPLGLTGPLVTYNLGLVILSGYMFYEVRCGSPQKWSTMLDCFTEETKESGHKPSS